MILSMRWLRTLCGNSIQVAPIFEDRKDTISSTIDIQKQKADLKTNHLVDDLVDEMVEDATESSGLYNNFKINTSWGSEVEVMEKSVFKNENLVQKDESGFFEEELVLL